MPFDEFLAAYRLACSIGDADAILGRVAEDYRGEYHYPAGLVRAFDRRALAEAWRAARDSFAAAGARWRYQHLAVGARDNERVVVSWVAFVVEGEATGHSLLTEVFRKTPGGWELAREHMEHRLERWWDTPTREETDGGTA